jgi:hypothetical protein
VGARLARKAVPVDSEQIRLLVSETLWALAIELSFGQTVAAGYAELIGEVPPERVDAYRRSVRAGGQAGPTPGRIMAECLPPVLVHGDAVLLSRFRRVWAAMLGKGSYILREPLSALGSLLKSGDIPGAEAFLDLLQTAFTQDLTYEDTRYFSGTLPRAALSLAPQRRCWQLVELQRVLRADRRMVEPFLTGLGRGLALLDEDALKAFVDVALQRALRRSSGERGDRPGSGPAAPVPACPHRARSHPAAPFGASRRLSRGDGAGAHGLLRR